MSPAVHQGLPGPGTEQMCKVCSLVVPTLQVRTLGSETLISLLRVTQLIGAETGLDPRPASIWPPHPAPPVDFH